MSRPALDADHNTEGLVCWCCPVYTDPDGNPLTLDQAEDAGDAVCIVHRSERADANDLTGPIPWQVPP